MTIRIGCAVRSAAAAHLAKAFDARLTFAAVASKVADSAELRQYKKAEGINPSEAAPILMEEAEACLNIAMEIANREDVKYAKRKTTLEILEPNAWPWSVALPLAATKIETFANAALGN